MEGEQKKERKKGPKRRIPRLTKIFIGLLGVYISFAFLMGGYELWQLQKQIKSLQLEQEMLMQKHNILKEDIDSLHNLEVIEKIARENLGMVKAGEVIVVPAIPDKNIPKPKEVPSHDLAE